jgi:hypothetical protein
VKGSAAILAGWLSRDGVGTYASGHSAGPPGVRKQLVHWWSGLNVVEVGGGMARCGIVQGAGAGVEYSSTCAYSRRLYYLRVIGTTPDTRVLESTVS